MKKLLSLFLFFISSQLLIGQVDTGFISFNEAYKIITDRNEYIAGEKVWFKLFSMANVDEVNSSKIAYIEIINPAGFSVSRKRITLEMGTGFGELQLPDTLSTGIYKLLGYTNWMRNSEIPAYSENLILIYNPEKPINRKINKTDKIKVVISLEGNELVSNLKNSIIYSLDKKDSNYGIIKIINPEDSIIKELKISNSFGKITFEPNINIPYILNYTDADTVINIPLSETKKEGLIFNLESFNNSSIDFTIQSTSTYKYDFKNLLYSLNNSNPQIFNHRNETNLTVSTDSLKGGLNQIFFYSPDGKLLWQREFFISKDKTELTIHGIDFNQIDTHKKLHLSISSGDLNNDFESADLSVVVRKIPNPYFCNYDSITNNLFKLKELYYFDYINNLLSFKTHNTTSKIKYLPEFKGALLSGKILNKEGLPLKENDVFLSFPDSIVKVIISRTNDAGEFYYFIKQNLPVKEIVLNANNHNQDLIILINNNFINEYSAPDQPMESIYGIEYKKYLDELFVNFRINQLYELNQAKKDSTIYSVKKSNLYQNVDRTFDLDKYVRLDSIHEYFYEIVQEVKIIREKKGRQLRVFNYKTNTLFEKNPALFIDGVYIEDPEYIFNLNSSDCKRIDVIQRPIMLKNRIYDGLIALFTYKNNLPVTLPTNTSRIELSLFDKSDHFEVLINKDQNMPDFRNTIYWNPTFMLTKNTSEKIEFLTGDDESWYEILIRGITNNGNPIYTRKTFKVTSSKIK